MTSDLCFDCGDREATYKCAGRCNACYMRHRRGIAVDGPPPIPELDLSWQIDAVCTQTDPELFFPEKGGSTKDAKGVCRRCCVRAECLSYALETGSRFGIWGMTSERERRRLQKLLGEAGAA